MKMDSVRSQLNQFYISETFLYTFQYNIPISVSIFQMMVFQEVSS